jgi:hypothetical protein
MMMLRMGLSRVNRVEGNGEDEDEDVNVGIK